MFKLAIICGGPSNERGISLNSARSFLDHTTPLGVDLVPLYVDQNLAYYQITKGQLYSNTPSDFDFKLKQIAHPLKENGLIQLLKGVDLVFPLIHGTYGEDGTLQAFLEKHQIPFVGSKSRVCQEIFNKQKARERMMKGGFLTLPSFLITNPKMSVEPFWEEHQLKNGIVKPTLSGSSLGVTFVPTIEAAQKAILELWGQGFHELILEPYCPWAEFSICVLENQKRQAVALLPIEMDPGKDPEGILDYRKKYLPSSEARYYCPPRFEKKIIQKIQKESEALFEHLGLNDFVRIDGWVNERGEPFFSDLNPISGMEQNSLIFQQSTRVGISHTDLIQYILENALKRYGKIPPFERKNREKGGEPIFILTGGLSSERQVALMSGTNVWLKLLHSGAYNPSLFLLGADETVWRLPYHLALHHTVEEISEHCQASDALIDQTAPFAKTIRHQLGLPESDFHLPEKIDLDRFITEAKASNAFVFIGLHGGMGESGELQQRLEEAGIPFNGCDAKVSSLCMDKHLTALTIESLNDPSILSMPQISFKKEEHNEKIWKIANEKFATSELIVKPQCDGCSTGVVRLSSLEEFSSYLSALRQNLSQLHVGSTPIALPVDKNQPFLLEPYISTDKIEIKNSTLFHHAVSGWCEMTVGVLEDQGDYVSLHPSITVAESHVLSVEEKFQGGTGINITPPPEHILSKEARSLLQERVCKAAKALGVKNYCRIDLFVELKTGIIQIIEVNTLPALTPSTVFFHQALSTFPNLYPHTLFAQIIESAKKGSLVSVG